MRLRHYNCWAGRILGLYWIASTFGLIFITGSTNSPLYIDNASIQWLVVTTPTILLVTCAKILDIWKETEQTIATMQARITDLEDQLDELNQ